MKKNLFAIFIITLSLTLDGCATRPPTEAATVLTPVVVEQNKAQGKPEIPTKRPAAATPVIPTPTPTSKQTFLDSDFGFRVQYDTSWHLETNADANATSRTILFKKNNYVLELDIASGPGDAESCKGLFQENPTNQYQKYSVDGVELWRIKAEQGLVNGYADNKVSYIDIISPLELYKEPKTDAQITTWGTYTCNPQINKHGVRIEYKLPVAQAKLNSDESSRQLLSEMDRIAASLTWQ